MLPSATAAAVRTSSRAAPPSGKARVISSARGRQSATQMTHGERNDRVSFVAAGQRKEREHSKLGGEEDWEGGGMDDSSRTGPPAGDNVEIVPKPAAAAANKIKSRKSKWTTTASLRVAEQGLKHQCWQVVGRKTTVPQQWKVAIAEMTTGAPWDIVFQPFTASAIISRFNNMLSDKSSRETEVSNATGGGQDGSENDDEEIKKLDKVLGQIVDAKAGLRHKVVQKEKTAINNAAGLAEEKNAERRCAPGTGATAFADVLKSLQGIIKDTTQKQDDSVRLQMQRDDLKEKRRQEDRDEAERIRREERKEAEQIRKEEMQQAELRRKEERDYDRILRHDEWDAERIERKAERKAEKEDRKEERAHELAMLQLQLELARTQARSDS